MRLRQLFCLISFALTPLPVLCQHPQRTAGVLDTLLDEIRKEATRSNRGEMGRPLPLAAHWNVSGMYMEGFTPAYQLQLLKKGHHILPWLEYPPTDHGLD